MARYKAADYSQLVMVPVSLENQLEPGTLEYAIYHLIEERLDMTVFDERYRNDETGRRAGRTLCSWRWRAASHESRITWHAGPHQAVQINGVLPLSVCLAGASPLYSWSIHDD